ncbi:SpoIIE family protein phosphatase [Streptomyces sp. URMC 123]|uniref:SpoIIE family protein phosphatase n=1 Tax=Streptomyces sp. URMC 123 TaxID=3423403 RepID=UPI003F1DDD61
MPDSSQPPDPLGAEELRLVLDGTPAGIAVLDTRLRYVYVNPALARMNGVPPEAHIGRTIAEVVPDIDAREDVLRAVLADGRPREVTSSGHTRAASSLERRYWHGAYHRLERHPGDAAAGGDRTGPGAAPGDRTEDGGGAGDRTDDRGSDAGSGRPRVLGLVGIVLEVSASRHQQNALQRASERLALLDTAATRIGTTLETDATCTELAEFLVRVLADAASVELLPNASGGSAALRPGAPLRVRRVALAAVPHLQDRVREFSPPGEDVEYQPGAVVPQCLGTGRPQMLNLLSDEQLRRAAPSADRLGAYRAAGFHSALVLPLVARGEPIGTVNMIRAGSSPAFSDEDLLAAQDLAGRAAVSLDNALRYTHEHGVALELQRALLSEPRAPHPDFEIASRYLPSGSSALVGGDWFDTIVLRDGRTLQVMGDVMGHGVAAAVAMSHYRAMLRLLATAGLEPEEMLARADRLIGAAGFDRAATCLLAMAEPGRDIRLSSAGHLPPAVLQPDGPTLLVRMSPGPPLGTGAGGGYEQVTIPCVPGPVLLLYTDGLVERRGEDIDVSLRRLTELRLPADASLDALLDQVLHRLDAGAAEDDVAVLAARVRPHASRP